MYLNIVIEHTIEISVTIESCSSLVRLEVFKLDNDIRPAREHGVHKPSNGTSSISSVYGKKGRRSNITYSSTISK
jgi:hypothetical protein